MKISKEFKSNIFGKRLKTARLSLGIPQDKLGVSIGLDEHTASARISRYESGVHEPAIPTAEKLAKTLNIPLAYLYCEDDRMALHLIEVASLNEAQWTELSAFMARQLGRTVK
jgi:transcriptional regulator with XRE-family HTH domain